MATNSNWTVIFDDKLIIKRKGDGAGIGYVINDDAFWSQDKFSNIWAIQHGASVSTDEVEYRDNTPHSAYADANLGDFNNFINKWDSVHLVVKQQAWDRDNIKIDGREKIQLHPSSIYSDPKIFYETESEKIARIGSRPTSYSSL